MPAFRESEIDRAIEAIRMGARPADVESETLDCKEDPSRRAPGGTLVAGDPRSEPAAYLLTEVCACLANHDGGAVLVGVDEKRAGLEALVGTDLDTTWLRARVRELTQPQLVVDVSARDLDGLRLLVIRVPRNAGNEPHNAAASKSGGRRQPRRVGTGCHDMATLAEQMAWLEARRGYDWSALPSGQPVGLARAASVEGLRDILGESDRDERRKLAELPNPDLLRRLQLVREDGRTLSRAGALLLCPSVSPGLVYNGRIAAGTPAEVRVDASGRGLIEEFRDVERAVAARNRLARLPAEGFAETALAAINPGVVREAIVNAVMHRDWDIPEPITIDHTGDELVVFSPGAPFGVEIDRFLTAPSRTRNRLLGDVLRSLGLAEREGTGVDRMYIQQIRLGHGPPAYQERSGGVRVTLAGGDPVPAVIRAHDALPEALRGDARAAVAIHLLRTATSLTRADIARAAQDDDAAVDAFIREAERGGLLQGTARPRPGGEAAWRLADPIRDRLGPILPYYARPIEDSVDLVESIARSQGGVRNQDVQDLLGISQVRASQVLRVAAAQGRIRLGPGSASRGRGVWYVATDGPAPVSGTVER